MRPLAGLLALTAYVGLAAAQTPALPAPAPTPTTPAADDLKKFQGFWKPDSLVADGEEKLPDAKQRELLTLVIKESEYRLYVASDPAQDKHMRLLTADFALDAAAKTFELTIKDGAKKGEKRHGIYSLADGKLQVCHGPADKPRPTKFEAAKGSDALLEKWSPEKR